MELTDTFILNNSDILFEDFDDEIVAINLKSGYYYSINGSGILIWELLTKSFSPRQIIKIHTNAFPGTDAEFEQSIKDFITELESEGILVQSGEEDEDAASNRLAQMEKVLNDKITSRWRELFGEENINFKEIKLDPRYSNGKLNISFKELLFHGKRNYYQINFYSNLIQTI